VCRAVRTSACKAIGWRRGGLNDCRGHRKGRPGPLGPAAERLSGGARKALRRILPSLRSHDHLFATAKIPQSSSSTVGTETK